MGLFSTADKAKIAAVAQASNELLSNPRSSVVAKPSKLEDQLNTSAALVAEYFKDSKCMLIRDEVALHEYIDKCIEFGYAGIDTETTGLDRIHDTIVGASLYVPGQVECYIPMKHINIYTDEPIRNQLTYEQFGKELQRLVDNKVKLILANADFDIAMIYKDIHVDIVPAFYYDVQIAWRCLKEDELDNTLKGLYRKYVMKGQGEAKKFSDLFSPKIFPYSKPEIAAPYAGNDAKITYELFRWQLPYVLKDNEKCKKNNLESIADLIWNVEFPLVAVCAMMHRTGVYLDKDVSNRLIPKYNKIISDEKQKLAGMVDDIIANVGFKSNMPFKTGKEFNPNSDNHVPYLVYDMLSVPVTSKHGRSTRKEVLEEINLPVTNQILKVRSLGVLVNSFVEKLPRSTTSDSRVHPSFKQLGAATGRFCIAAGTKITILNGYKNIEDIVPGDLVYCYDENGVLQLSPVKNLWLTGRNQECVRIKWQSSGQGDIGELICTPEHKVLTKSGNWVRAVDLKRYDKLAHLRRTVSNSRERRPDLYGWNGLAIKEQDVVKYSIFNCEDSSNYVIHHKDENPDNNDINNLELMTVQDHSAYHTTKMNVEGRLRYDHLQSPEIRAKRIEVIKANHINKVKASKDELLQMIADCNGVLHKVAADFDTFKRNCAIAGIDVEAECRKYNPKWHKPKILESEFKEVYEQYNGLAVRITEHFNISYDKFYKYCEEYNISRNHMVQSVEYAGQYDVYDIEVEQYHNFIANEICVHNSSENPNAQNIPSHATDIRHMFRATPGYVMLSSDFSSQEPRITAFVSQDPKMIQAFKDDKDIYATIASVALGVPYERCLEFHPVTKEYQPDGKERRSQAKFIVLGICYGRSVSSIAEQLYGSNQTMTDEEKTREAQKVYDAVLSAFPNLESAMHNAQAHAKAKGYVQTILGRRRHIPDMMLEEFEFKPMVNYVNPYVDPMDVDTLSNKDSIPKQVVDDLLHEFKSYSYKQFGKMARRIDELKDEGIKVYNNRSKIREAKRQCLNSIIQGSAADQTKLAILKLVNDPEWHEIGGRLLIPVHDELIAEVPLEHWKRGGEILRRCMVESADFLPFPSKCDVTTTLRWYGLEYPCKYPQPDSLDGMTEDEIKWVQYMLVECEYDLPSYKDKNGDSPIGDAALGVNGVISPEFNDAIKDFKLRYNLTSDVDFINKIKRKVIEGEN